MTTHTRAVAEAFSGHRFAEAYDHLAPAVRWVVRGEEITEGKDDVIAACEQTLTELTNVTTEFTRFVVAADDDTAAVDATGRYTGPDGTASVVSSCDIFEFHESLVVRITSYAVEEEAR
jgi:ketosteroid isomerase-like protein